MGEQKKYTDEVQAIAKALIPWYLKNARDLPWRRKPYCSDPYCVYVSEIMLQQTQVKTVMPYWERWMKALPTVRSLAEARPERIHKLWEGLGYYTRVRNMQKAARVIEAEHGGRFPNDFDAVLALPGIGRYTAGAICSIAFNQPTPILDGNVMRVLSRLFGVRGNPRKGKANDKLWRLAEQLVRQAAPKHCSELNQSLMELGALICTPQNARCGECPLALHCVALRQGKVDQLPERAERPTVTRRQFAAFVVRNNGAIFVRQRPEGVVNARLWEFPNIELFPGDGDPQKAARAALGAAGGSLKKIGTIRHSITRYAISMDVFEAGTHPQEIRAQGEWVERRRAGKLAFCAAHKRILKQITGPKITNSKE